MGNLLGTIVAVLAFVIAFTLISLFFIKLGWYLFAVPVLGLPDLTWLQALGFALLASAFRSTSTKKD